jgi:RNA polymerase sigma-70 factor (ECF subfamily)
MPRWTMIRRRAKHTELPDEAVLSDLGDAEASLADRLDGEHYRDDILRLLFVCCHPELPRRSRSRSPCASSAASR